jgi:hypothetical protein
LTDLKERSDYGGVNLLSVFTYPSSLLWLHWCYFQLCIELPKRTNLFLIESCVKVLEFFAIGYQFLDATVIAKNDRILLVFIGFARTPIQGGKSRTSVLQKYKKVHEVHKYAFLPLFRPQDHLSWVLSFKFSEFANSQ